MVYIREAHAADGRRPDRRMGVNEPTTFSERLDVAKTCQSDLGLKLPMLIDDMKNSTDKAYTAMPDRLFLVDTQRLVAYRGGRGPRGFKPQELEAAIKTLLASGGKIEEPKTLDAKAKAAILERLKARRKAALDSAKAKTPAKKTTKKE